MADALREQLSVEPKLIPGSRGIFEVAVAGRVVAKKSIDGFPTSERCVDAVREALAS